jgi:hypothetical protein
MIKCKKIKIGSYVITVGPFADGGSIQSNLRENCPICKAECYGGCESIQSIIDSKEVEASEDKIYRFLLNTAMGAVESMILAHYCAGVDIESKEYVQGLETAIEAIKDNI